MKKAYIYWLFLFVIFFSACSRGGPIEVDLDTLQTEEVQIGSLNAFVGGTGTVRANQSVTLAWQASGIVGDVRVEVSDKVEADERIANLSKTSLPQNIILAQADLENARESLEDFYDSYGELGIAQAAKDLADAEDAVRDAGIRLNNLKYTASQDNIDAAFADVVLAENQLLRARRLFDQYKDKPETDLKRASALTSMNQAQNAYNSALRTYNYMTGTADSIEIAKAEADLELVKVQFADAETEYERVLAGPTEDKIASAESKVTAAQATLNQAMIIAPFDGTVTQVFSKQGDLVSAGEAAFRIDDLSRDFIDVNISEVDINQVEVGQDVELIFDAILAREYHGIVTDVSLVGETIQGIASFKVTIEITDGDELVKSGMTAAVNIIISELKDVIVVPNRAVRVLDGVRVVYVLEGDELIPVEITLGASSDTHSEILEGELEPGDLVALNPPANFEPGPPNGGGRGGPP